jgi:hypothetical protein
MTSMYVVSRLFLICSSSNVDEVIIIESQENFDYLKEIKESTTLFEVRDGRSW